MLEVLGHQNILPSTAVEIHPRGSLTGTCPIPNSDAGSMSVEAPADCLLCLSNGLQISAVGTFNQVDDIEALAAYCIMDNERGAYAYTVEGVAVLEVCGRQHITLC